MIGSADHGRQGQGAEEPAPEPDGARERAGHRERFGPEFRERHIEAAHTGALVADQSAPRLDPSSSARRVLCPVSLVVSPSCCALAAFTGRM